MAISNIPEGMQPCPNCNCYSLACKCKPLPAEIVLPKPKWNFANDRPHTEAVVSQKEAYAVYDAYIQSMERERASQVQLSKWMLYNNLCEEHAKDAQQMNMPSASCVRCLLTTATSKRFAAESRIAELEAVIAELRAVPESLEELLVKDTATWNPLHIESINRRIQAAEKIGDVSGFKKGLEAAAKLCEEAYRGVGKQEYGSAADHVMRGVTLCEASIRNLIEKDTNGA